MTLREIMQYRESEFEVISVTPCEVCGGAYVAESSSVAVIDDMAYDICGCICSSCGYEKVFEFAAPFVVEENLDNIKNNLN